MSPAIMLQPATREIPTRCIVTSFKGLILVSPLLNVVLWVIVVDEFCLLLLGRIPIGIGRDFGSGMND